MGLDVDIPEPPQLSNRGVPSEFEAVGGAGDLRRDELEGVLDAGAWNEAFEEWAEYTDLTAEEFAIAQSLGLVEELDVFWDPTDARLRVEVPAVPEDWADRVDEAPPDPAGLAWKLEYELADLGETLLEMLEDGYVDWGSEESEDVVWSEETFGHGTAE